MAEHRLMRRVDEVAERLQEVRRLRVRSRIWFLLSFLGLALLAANWFAATPLLPPAMTVTAGLLLLIIGGLLAFRTRASAYDAALAIEQRYPDLDSRLVTSIGQRPNMDEGGFSFLQHEVISESLLHAQRHDWREAVPSRAIAGAKLRQTAALLLFVAAFTAAAIAGRRPFSSNSVAMQAGESTDAPADGYGLTVEPGDVQLERGTSLLVLARFAHQLPGDVTLITNAADGSREEIPLSKSLDDPLFGGRVAQVKQDLSYHVRFDDRQSDDYRVSVFDYPQLQQADAKIQYPEYTGMAVKHIEDVRRVSVVEGSDLTLMCTINKPVTIARLFADDGTDHELVADQLHPNVVSVTWQPQERQTLTLELIDDADRHNKQPPQFVVDVIPNQPPDLKVAFPAKDMRVSPLQELPLEAQIWDDFGLKEFGLVYQLPAGDEQTLKLGGDAAPDATVELAHQISFEQIKAQPNELVSYYFYADDVGPKGESRRTLSNMYFAEVRHFDEIYRQVVPTGKSQGEGMSCTKLIKLQRDIVTANWNLVRREHDEPSEKLPADAGTVADSQATAIEIAQQIKLTLEDLLSLQYIAEAIEHMEAGEEHLRTAAQTPAVPPLGDARSETQEAYSALLKLQARETLVKKCQPGKSASNSEQQQQLNDQLKQLELKNNRNRYEAESQDTPPADREAMQVLNRLRELARRQGDLNDKIKELENALRAAQTDAEREEIERQLKRLQDEQQQLLRDLDEMKERMEKPENRSRMAEARKQVEETREHLRQTKESLQAGQVSKALAEGTRAKRELEGLKEQFRDQTAGQFADTMRELRDEARELAKQEQELGDQLAGKNAGEPTPEKTGGRPSLRDETPEGKDLPEAVTEQQQRLSNVVERAEEIVRQAEFTEPLLSKKLYDAVRKTRSDQPEESLAMTSQFLKLGLKREATEAEQQARRGIDKLQEGIEQAAESVLGNEAAALARAHKEIDDLAQAIASELAQADPKFAEQMKQAAEQGSESAGDKPQSKSGSGKPSDQSPSEKSAEDQSEPKPGEPSTSKPGDKSGEASQGEPKQQGQPSQQEKAGEGKPSEQPGTKPGKGQGGQSPSGQGKEGQQGQGGKPSESQPAQAKGGSGGGDKPGQGTKPGRGDAKSNSKNALSTLLSRGGADSGGATGPHLGPNGPLTSSEFVMWSDRMRDVEEMLNDPELRAEAARIRDRAREVRIDIKRHSKEPDWDLVRMSIYGPMLELQDRLAEEIARTEPDSEEIVPLDRDPVPDRYADLVRKYYERLGSGR